MPAFIQVDSGVDQTNRDKHLDLIDLANGICYAFSHRLGKYPVSLVYNSATKDCSSHKDFVEDVTVSDFICENVNEFLRLYKKFNNTFKCLPFYFEFIEESKGQIDNEQFNTLFQDFDLSSILDDSEASFLKHKINSELV